VIIGASGIGELLANTLAVRNVTVVVLDVKVPTLDGGGQLYHRCDAQCMFSDYAVSFCFADNITFYKCDVSRWDEVEKVSKRILNEVWHILRFSAR